ncbi:MAG TPA: hypothetical protein VII94_05910 [Candidatus Saccharimonadales bacterium]
MSDTILSGDFTVYYLAENRQKLVVWTGSATGTRTVNELYSALADLMDDQNQMDDGSVMSAQTPTAYTIGIIDSSDKDPWFIDRTSVEHLVGGAITTNGWARVTSSNTGIVRITYTVGTNFITSDIGKTVTNATSTATGTLLDFATSGGTKYAWIRPTDSTSTNNWSGTSGTITVTSGSAATVTQATASVTGEALWANIYNTGIATLVANTSQYVYQNGVKLTSYKGTFSWWPDGTFDVLVLVKDVGSFIDGGFITVFAREADAAYAYFISNLSGGGRNPIPLQTGSDLNNENIGYRTLTGSSGSGTFVSGEIIYYPGGGSLSAATSKAIVTSVTGTTGAPIIAYYLIGALTDFSSGNAIKGNTSTATCTAGTPSDTAIASYTITNTFGANDTFDINENGSTEPYSIVVNLASTYTVLQGYQWEQWLTRRGGTTTTNTNGIDGEGYIGEDYRMTYTTLTGTVSEGSVVTGNTSAATGTVVAHHTSSKILVLRNSRGTFSATETVQVSGGNNVSNVVPVSITPQGAAPFGIFAGGSWFCANGVVLNNELTTDVNKFQLTDDTGTTVKAPTKVTVTITNTATGDGVAVFRLTGSGGTINKAEYNATAQSAGATTVIVGTSIAGDEPGKTVGGIIRLVDVSANEEYRIRYSSYTASTFTLASYTGLTATTGTNQTTIIDSSATFVTHGILVGDVVRNTTHAGVGYVVSVNSETSLTVENMAATQVSGDSFEINTLPFIPTTSDTVYVPIIDVHDSSGTGSEAINMTYISDVPVIVRARNAGVILPFESPGTIGSTGLSLAVIRTPDTIFT